jgi:hypothetical protein
MKRRRPILSAYPEHRVLLVSQTKASHIRKRIKGYYNPMIVTVFPSMVCLSV